jgi:hypothetical protein
MPYCPHCNQRTFEIEALDLAGRPYNCVQCSGCKAPVAFIEHARVEQSTDPSEPALSDVLGVMISSLQTINSRLARIEQMMQTRR